ncbi:hypothetical protein Lalb_Chr06g0168951 [Lupinus albus]|uniref:Uncharacterized protein n=1 Tax=Lupinus albus TaxID=3870 RepID=A0A6A4QDH0_LUPAL|nr:hypothetical protein Lalb_Chr06g0168951 [Lupinus albus]
MSPLPNSLILLTTLLFLSHLLYIECEPDNVQTLNTNPSHYSKFNPKIPPLRTLSSSKRFEGSSDLVNLKYHMGPVLSSPINIYLIWNQNNNDQVSEPWCWVHGGNYHKSCMLPKY